MSTPFTGTFLLEDGEALASAIESQDWVAGGLAGFSALLDAAAAISDPIGQLIAMGLGWAMEHLEPLRGWLNDLTGDASEVAAFVQTWANVATQLNSSSSTVTSMLSDLDDMDGATINAYVAFQVDAAKHLAAAGHWASAMSAGLEVCSMIVKIVHDITRDAISQVVGSVISYVLELAVTLGAATPLVLEQVTTRVAALADGVGTAITRMLASGKALEKNLDELGEVFKEADTLFKQLPATPREVPAKPTPGTKPPRKPKNPLYKRPTHWRKGVRDEAYDSVLHDRGEVMDPGTRNPIGRDAPYVMGHKPGWEFWKHVASAERRGLTREQFLDEHFDSSHYRPETPETSSSHRQEGPDDLDYWAEYYG